MTAIGTEDQRLALITEAENAYRDYRTFAGHWSGWQLRRVGRKDLWRWGVTLLRRDTLVIAHPSPCDEHPGCRIVYSTIKLLDVHCPEHYLTTEE
jgi:hypothetical protein